MSRLTWHNPGEKRYERGVQNVVLFPFNSLTNTFSKGVAWNGCTAVNESPSGAEPTDLWADNRKYATFRSKEEFGLTIEAYAYPDEWYPCDGMDISTGAIITGQLRRKFCLAYRSEVGNDLAEDFGYKIRIAYGLTASPSEKSNTTINDSPEAQTFSWECSSTPVPVSVLPNETETSLIIVDSTVVGMAAMYAIEAVLYGTNDIPGDPLADPPVDPVPGSDPQLLMPDEVVALIAANPAP